MVVCTDCTAPCPHYGACDCYDLCPACAIRREQREETLHGYEEEGRRQYGTALTLSAMRVAMLSFADKLDKTGREPMILHSLRVGLKGLTPAERAVGFLHDVLEDTRCPLATLQRIFPPHIVAAVQALTRPPRGPERPPWEAYIQGIMEAGDLAIAVKLNDLADNLGRVEGLRAVGTNVEKLASEYRWAQAKLELARRP